MELRLQLTKDGLDAGPVTIAWHLEQEGHRPPSTSTIRRILHAAGLITPEPRKRPRSSYRRFAAAQPNECWQSDFTHWQLADGTDVEILNWLDDHSRYLLGCTAHTPVTGDLVVSTFLTVADQYGFPASTLTDNGRVYTARFGGGKNAFEYLLPLLGITQKNGHPGHPQTQGKVETLPPDPQALARPPARSRDLDRPPDPTRRRGARSTTSSDPTASSAGEPPATAYAALPKAAPTGPRSPGHYRLRYDRLDTLGEVSFRRAGRMHHLGVGTVHARTRVLAIADDTTVTVIELDTGEILSTHNIEPTKTYWRNTQRAPGRWPRALE